jgi:CrcB protein
MLALAVAAASGAGAVCRYLLDRAVQRRIRGAFPYGIFVVNITGSLLLGLVTGLALHHGLPDGPTAVLSAGFAGGYTTFSALAGEALALALVGAWRTAVANVVFSVAVGLAAAAAGLALALV